MSNKPFFLRLLALGWLFLGAALFGYTIYVLKNGDIFRTLVYAIFSAAYFYFYFNLIKVDKNIRGIIVKFCSFFIILSLLFVVIGSLSDPKNTLSLIKNFLITHLFDGINVYYLTRKSMINLFNPVKEPETITVKIY